MARHGRGVLAGSEAAPRGLEGCVARPWHRSAPRSRGRTPESGYRAGRTIAAIPDVTAVYVGSDEMAFGLLRAFHEAGRQVPEDISVVSVDDISLAAYAAPALTTVRQPFQSLGRAAALRVISRIEGDLEVDIPPTEPTLVVRSSTAAR